MCVDIRYGTNTVTNVIKFLFPITKSQTYVIIKENSWGVYVYIKRKNPTIMYRFIITCVDYVSFLCIQNVVCMVSYILWVRLRNLMLWIIGRLNLFRYIEPDWGKIHNLNLLNPSTLHQISAILGPESKMDTPVSPSPPFIKGVWSTEKVSCLDPDD